MFRLKKIRTALFICWLVGVLFWAVTSSSSAPAALSKSASKSSSTSIAKHPKIGETECNICHGDLVEHKNVHPVAVDCTSCHEYSETKEKEDGEVKFVSEGNALCLMCHSDQEEALAKEKFKHSAVEAGCTFCHSPHSTDEPVLLKDKVNQLCFTCHSEKQEELTEKPFVHAPAKDVGCVACHNPHTSNFSPLLKVEGNDLCLSCHKIGAGSKKDKTSALILNQRLIPEGYADKAKKILLSRNGNGHPYIGHPVKGVPDPSDKPKMMSCSSCHNPHAGKVVQMYKGDVSKSELCDRCHK